MEWFCTWGGWLLVALLGWVFWVFQVRLTNKAIAHLEGASILLNSHPRVKFRRLLFDAMEEVDPLYGHTDKDRRRMALAWLEEDHSEEE